MEDYNKLLKLLTDGLVIRVEAKKQELRSSGVSEDKLDDEITVLLLADLQQKQLLESSALNKVLETAVRMISFQSHFSP